MEYSSCTYLTNLLRNPVPQLSREKGKSGHGKGSRGLPELGMTDTLGIWPTRGPGRPRGSPHPLKSSQFPGPDSSSPLYRNGRKGADQQLEGWQGPDIGSPAFLALSESTYCCGPRRGQCLRSRPHSQCLRYLHCCPLGTYPERRRACPGLALRVLCCG
jgi:hypothetical protein